MRTYSLCYLLQSSDLSVCNGYEIDNYWPNYEGKGSICLMCGDDEIARFPDDQRIHFDDQGVPMPIEVDGNLHHFEFKVLTPRILPAAIDTLVQNLLTQDVRATSEPQYRVMEDEKVIQQFLTNEAAKSFIEAHEHNYDKPYIYVGSGWKNDEWIAVRKFFMGMPV